MLLLCSVACLYEIACRHWKLVRALLLCVATVFPEQFDQAAAGGVALLACVVLPMMAFFRLLGQDFHFELH